MDDAGPRFGLALLANWVSRIAVGVGLAYTAVFLVIALLRIGYPYELEWLEGSMVEHTYRVLHGLPLYAKPSLEFVAAIYTPFYFQVSALFAWMLGIGFLPLRLVSFLSACGTFGLIYLFVWRDTGKVQPALVAAGLFAAAYGVTGYFFDMARVDSFALYMLLWGAYLVYRAESFRGAAAAAVILALAFFAKQSAVPAIGLLALVVSWRLRLKSISFHIVLIVLTVGGVLWFNDRSGGWFWYYVFDLPSRPAIDRRFVDIFWSRDLARDAWALCLACLLYLYALVRSRNLSGLLFSICLLLGFGAVSFLGRVHVGGHTNTLMPIYAVLAIMAGRLLGGVEALRLPSRVPPASVVILTGIALVVQMAMFAYDPTKLVPSAEMKTAGERFVRVLSAFPGEPYVPYHGYLSRMAGTEASRHQQTAVDLSLGDPAAATRLGNELLQSIRTRRYGLLVLHERWPSAALDSNYREIPCPLGDSAIYHAWIEGQYYRPQFWYVPRTDSL
jgi:hypothetical protein